MIFHNDKTTINKHVGLSAFHTTPINFQILENSIIYPRYPRKNNRYVFSEEYWFINPQTMRYFSISVMCYKNAITNLKAGGVECI